MKSIFLLLAFSLLSATTIFARSGCCSHHQGVCGCGCCDGSSLSDVCAPYYPECNGGAGPLPTWTTIPSNIPSPIVTRIPTPTLTSTITPTLTKKPAKMIKTISIKKTKQMDFWNWLLTFFK